MIPRANGVASFGSCRDSYVLQTCTMLPNCSHFVVDRLLKEPIAGQPRPAALNVPINRKHDHVAMSRTTIGRGRSHRRNQASIRNKERPHAIPIARLPLGARDDAIDSIQNRLGRLHIFRLGHRPTRMTCDRACGPRRSWTGCSLRQYGGGGKARTAESSNTADACFIQTP